MGFRGHLDLNQRPLDLQSNALPLSYTPPAWVVAVLLSLLCLQSAPDFSVWGVPSKHSRGSSAGDGAAGGEEQEEAAGGRRAGSSHHSQTHPDGKTTALTRNTIISVGAVFQRGKVILVLIQDGQTSHLPSATQTNIQCWKKYSDPLLRIFSKSKTIKQYQILQYK